MKITDKDLAFLLFCLCVLAAMFSPNEAKGQNTLKIENPKQVGLEVYKNTPTGAIYIGSGVDTVWADPNLGKVTKDTIQVEVLCRQYMEANISIDGQMQMDFFMGMRFRVKRMERTFEMQCVPVITTPKFQNGAWISDAMSRWETKPIQIESRYLDNTDGCYQLIPIKDGDQ